MIVSLEAQGTNTYNRYAMWIFGYYKLNVLTLARITTIMYDFFTCAHIQIFFCLVLSMITIFLVNEKKKIINEFSTGYLHSENKWKILQTTLLRQTVTT